MTGPRWVRRLLASDSELEREELQSEVTRSGCAPIAQCAGREVVHVAGTLRMVTYFPDDPMRLEAELYDGSGSLWLVVPAAPAPEGRTVSQVLRLLERSTL